MAEKEENSLIGYDPLAWMLQADEDRQMPTAPVAVPETEWTVEEPVGSDVLAETEADAQAQTAGEQWRETGLVPEVGPSAAVAKIELEPVLSIQHVGALRERFLAALEGFDKIEIDASAVVTADTATLQLLLILKRTAIGLNKEVVIDFPSDRFVEACDLLGISEMLGVDQAAAGFF